MTPPRVVVVGAGPAGSSAALNCARAGARVKVLDRARFPRDKCCGDGLTTLALRELELLGLDPTILPSWQAVQSVRVAAPSGRVARLEMPDGPGVHAAVVTRRELDAALVRLLVDHRVDVCLGAAATDVVPDAEGVTVEVAGAEAVRADYVVAADGMWSAMRHSLHLDDRDYLGEWHAFRRYFEGVGPAAQALWVRFEPDLLPGYAWSFPLPGGRANVGFGVLREPGRRLPHAQSLWDDLLARPTISRVLHGAVPHGP